MKEFKIFFAQRFHKFGGGGAVLSATPVEFHASMYGSTKRGGCMNITVDDAVIMDAINSLELGGLEAYAVGIEQKPTALAFDSPWLFPRFKGMKTCLHLSLRERETGKSRHNTSIWLEEVVMWGMKGNIEVLPSFGITKEGLALNIPSLPSFVGEETGVVYA